MRLKALARAKDGGGLADHGDGVGLLSQVPCALIIPV